MSISQRLYKAENTPNQEEPARKKQEEITGPGTAKDGYRPHTSKDSHRNPSEGVIVAGTTEEFIVAGTMEGVTVLGITGVTLSA
jgi:hypothetical protein